MIHGPQELVGGLEEWRSGPRFSRPTAALASSCDDKGTALSSLLISSFTLLSLEEIEYSIDFLHGCLATLVQDYATVCSRKLSKILLLRSHESTAVT